MNKLYNIIALLFFFIFVSVFIFNSINPFYKLPDLELTCSGQGMVYPGEKQDILLIVRERQDNSFFSGLNVELYVALENDENYISRSKFRFIEFKKGFYKATFSIPPEVENGNIVFSVYCSGKKDFPLIRFKYPVNKKYIFAYNTRKPDFTPGKMVTLDFSVADALKGKSITPIQSVRCSVQSPEKITLFSRLVPMSRFGRGFFNFLLPDNSPSGEYRVNFEIANHESSLLFSINKSDFLSEYFSGINLKSFSVKKSQITSVSEAPLYLPDSSNSSIIFPGEIISAKHSRNGLTIKIADSTQNSLPKYLEIWNNGLLADLYYSNQLPVKKTVFFPKNRIGKGIFQVKYWQESPLKILDENIFVQPALNSQFFKVFSSMMSKLSSYKDKQEYFRKTFYKDRTNDLYGCYFNESKFPLKTIMISFSDYFIFIYAVFVIMLYSLGSIFHTAFQKSNIGRMFFSFENAIFALLMLIFSRSEFHNFRIAANVLIILSFISVKYYLYRSLPEKSFVNLALLCTGLNVFIYLHENADFLEYIPQKQLFVVFFITWLLLIFEYVNFLSFCSKIMQYLLRIQKFFSEISDLFLNKISLSPEKATAAICFIFLGICMFLVSFTNYSYPVTFHSEKRSVKTLKAFSPPEEPLTIEAKSLCDTLRYTLKDTLPEIYGFMSLCYQIKAGFSNKNSSENYSRFFIAKRELDLFDTHLSALRIFQKETDYLKRIIEIFDSEKSNLLSDVIKFYAHCELFRRVPENMKKSELLQMESLLFPISHTLLSITEDEKNNSDIVMAISLLDPDRIRGVMEISPEIDSRIYELKHSFLPKALNNATSAVHFSGADFFGQSTPFFPLMNGDYFLNHGKIVVVGKSGKIPLKLGGKTLELKMGKNFPENFLPQKILILRNEPALIELVGKK
ncbi:MAG: hypothetical protein HQM10_24855 [Candidatus Riflebacteria bacterium]|nr:hypothetical protein [Candidatus Riflebacteria bacterium]